MAVVEAGLLHCIDSDGFRNSPLPRALKEHAFLLLFTRCRPEIDQQRGEHAIDQPHRVPLPITRHPGSSRNSPRWLKRLLKEPIGCTKSRWTVIGCMPGSTPVGSKF